MIKKKLLTSKHLLILTLTLCSNVYPMHNLHTSMATLPNTEITKKTNAKKPKCSTLFYKIPTIISNIWRKAYEHNAELYKDIPIKYRHRGIR